VRFSTEDWDWLGEFLKRRGLPGIAVALMDARGDVGFIAKGWADLGRRPIDEETLFELGSIGKTFTAVVTLELAEEGRVDLEAPVTRYLPWFEVRSPFDSITLAHLLTHTAGLIRGADMTADSRFDVWALRDTEVGFPPGERHYYSNVGYRVLGCVLEEVTGVRYTDLIRSRILERLGLENTEPAITADMRLRMAVGYDRLHDDRTPDPADPLVPAAWLETDTADGSLASTAGDLSAFGRALLAGPARQLTSGRLADSGDGWSYGYGLEVKGSLIRHGGSMPGFASTLLGDLDSGVAVATLMNGPDERDVTEEVAQYALALELGDSPEPPGDPKPYPSDLTLAEPSEEWGAFYGRYRSYNPWLPGFRFVQWAEGPGVVLSWGNEKPLTPLGEAEFRVGAEEWSPERLRFDAVVDGLALRANLSGETYYRSNFP
jgi:CubicO group peptidase (beta-lactamase class C family)